MHTIDMEIVREELKDAPRMVRSILEQARSDHRRLSRLHREAGIWAAYQTAAEAGNPDLLLALQIAARAAAASLLLASHPGETFTISLGEGAPATLTGEGPDSTTSVSTWLGGFRAASICRDLEAIRWLLDVPTSVLRASSTQGDDYAYDYVDALRGFWSKDSTTVARLVLAIEGTDPVKLVNADPDYVMDLVVPEMEIFLHILSNDAASVNDALRKALALHESYWGEESRQDDFDGFLALGPLAMAAIAHDRGIPIEVESGYMPAWLVRGEWAPE